MLNNHHIRTIDAAQGKWRGILLELGVPEKHLRNKHGPCPLCGGKDRFRFDNKDGRGTYICGQCGAGNGMDLAMKFTGKCFAEVAGRIDAIVGNLKPEAPQLERSQESSRALLRKTFAESQPIQPNDLADRYFQSRGIGEMVYPRALRFAPRLKDGEGGIRPAIVAVVGVHGEKQAATLHRTFLSPSGGKANMRSPRKLMPSEVPDGACVQLSNYQGGPLGIAEGIETALAASHLFNIPVWAALNAAMLQKWTSPEGCREVAVFGDNDATFTGQSAAYALARKLSAKGVKATVHIPQKIGADWNDELITEKPPQNTLTASIDRP